MPPQRLSYEQINTLQPAMEQCLSGRERCATLLLARLKQAEDIWMFVSNT